MPESGNAIRMALSKPSGRQATHLSCSHGADHPVVSARTNEEPELTATPEHNVIDGKLLTTNGFIPEGPDATSRQWALGYSSGNASVHCPAPQNPDMEWSKQNMLQGLLAGLALLGHRIEAPEHNVVPPAPLLGRLQPLLRPWENC